MAQNIVSAIQEKMGFTPFEKIDPNLPQDKTDLKLNPATNHYTQATVITALAGIYEWGSSTDGAAQLQETGQEDNLLQTIFGDRETDIINAVSYYGDKNKGATAQLMKKVAREAITLIKDNVGENSTPEKIVVYVASQRHNIFVYLPPDLQLGNLINDNSIDDVTNKMEGPVSSLMHFFESLFAEKK